MAKRSACRLPTPFEGDPPITKCGTAKGMTLCEGDRVERLPVKDRGKLIRFKHKGTVMGVQMSQDNRGRKQLAARVCFDSDEPGDLAYPYLFVELKKSK